MSKAEILARLLVFEQQLDQTRAKLSLLIQDVLDSMDDGELE